MRLPHIKLLTFDATNTLIRFTRSIGAEYESIASQYGVQLIQDANEFGRDTIVTKERENAAAALSSNGVKSHLPRTREEVQSLLSESFIKAYRTQRDLHPNFGVNDGLNPVQWWTSVVSYTFRNAGYDHNQVSDAQLKAISAHLYKLYSTGSTSTVKEGVRETLQAIRLWRPSIILGVISNYDERLEKLLMQLNVRHFFNFVIVSTQVRCVKPDVKIFQEAIRQASECAENPIEPSEALHIGDNYQNDYIGALKAGWSAALIIENKKLIDPSWELQRPEDILSSITDLKNYLGIKVDEGHIRCSS